jgi:hypothetical protein
MDTLGLFEILLPLIWGGVAVWELLRSFRAGCAHLFRIEYRRDGDKPAFWAVTLVWVAGPASPSPPSERPCGLPATRRRIPRTGRCSS